jgi:DNA invertase Pin-like site-specific DNA recombinase/PHD/YefM family antitoxin component YafN of YafNO toxin-antitoxin module
VNSGATSPSATKRASLRRAIGVVRVSRVGARSGEQFVSPSEQRTRIEEACARDGLLLVETLEELDVSGGAALAKRPGLRHAVELVEAGEADTVVVAYFDRLVRSLKVQLEVAERVEAAGGKILALDVGEVGVGATGKLTAQFLGAVAEYHRNVTAERTAEAKRRAIARGVPTFSKIPPGYRQCDDGTLEPHPKEAARVAEAFRLRAEGATVAETREYLRKHGIDRSYHGTQAILTSRMYLGELRFGALVNTASHPAIVDADTWARVQRMRSPRGRRAKSERLLARLGVLRCGTCGSRMVVGSSNHSHYWIYRCPPVGDCPKRVTISADIAEAAVVAKVRELLTEVKGTATVGGATEQAERDFTHAEAELAAAVEAFTGLEDVAAAREKLQSLREARDQARDRLDELQAAQAPAVTVTAEDWDMLTLAEQRALIRAVIDRAEVAPGRGRDRITVVAR